MTALADPRLRLLMDQLVEDLRPDAGRSALTVRIATMCAVMTLLAMMFELQEPAISCYLLIFLVKPDAITNMVIAMGAIVAVTLIAPVLVVLTVWTIDVPAARMLVIVFSSLLFLYLGSASRLGEGGGIVALVIAFYMSLLGYVPLGEIVSRGVVDAWLMVAAPMVVMLVFNLYAGRSSAAVLREQLALRLEAAAAAAQGLPAPALRSDPSQLLLTARLVEMLAGAPKHSARWMTRATVATCRLHLAVSALPTALGNAARRQIAEACRRTSRRLLQGVPADHSGEVPAEGADPAAGEALAALEAMRQPAPGGGDPSARRDAFFAPDAFSNPAHARYAIKATAAAMVCYVTYTALDWQGIHTAMVTCYVTALGTAGETVHKLALRIAGCLLGAAMGIVSLVYVMPHIDDIGGLLVLVLVGLLPAAWVRAGGERVSYAGVQIALAFLLTVLQGFGPTSDVDTARDRVLGILFGNLVVYLVFTRVWPVPVVQAVSDAIDRAFAHLSTLSKLPHSLREDAVHEAIAADAALRAATQQMELAGFEPPHLRPADPGRQWLTRVTHELWALTADLFVARDVELRQVAQLERIASRWRHRDMASFLQRVSADGLEASGGGDEAHGLDARLRRLDALMDGGRRDATQ